MSDPEINSRDVAIIGMAGRFPGAETIEEFWRNLREGVKSVSFFAGSPRPETAGGRYVAARGILEGVDLFDATFFGFSPREAEVMDPQHRLMLESAWEALERAGYDPESFPGLIGVYLGVGPNTYAWNNLSPELIASIGDFEVMLGNDKDYLPTQISYRFNLRGPSLAVQTACSSSLVAVHQACLSLQAYDCDIALAGGVSVRIPQEAGYFYREGGILSPDGHCRAFDVRAAGTVSGNGLGLVVLRRLTDALEDGDPILAVIRGSAVNNDGGFKIGYTAPSETGQAEVIATAQAVAGVDPSTINYVEAHGTGTVLGDPIEVAALSQIFRSDAGGRSCALGSVKVNIGHLDVAAGVAGLVKTVLAFQHGTIPPHPDFESPNPRLRLEESPFFVNSTPMPWERNGTPRRAGISSFGIGGTNAHVILEEAPPHPPDERPSRPFQLLVLSARSAAALERATANLGACLTAGPELDLADVAHTLRVGRKTFEHRRFLVTDGLGEAAATLGGARPERLSTAYQEGRDRPVAFLFPGQGTQYPGMTAGLYATEPVFREQIDLAAEALAGELEWDLRDLLYPSDQGSEEAAARLTRTATAQPALFAVEHALARLWMSWGVRPEAMLGHSVGEYVAACLAGVFSPEDGLALVAARGRLMDELPPGGMLTVHLPEEEVRRMLDGGLSIAAVNAPRMCVVSGPLDDIEAFSALLAEQGIESQRLRTSHAFHSTMVEPVLDRFAERVATVRLNPPGLRYLSNVTGTWIDPKEAIRPAYWVKHLRREVRFSEGVRALLSLPDLVFLEVGPGDALGALVRQHPESAGRTVLGSVRRARDAQPDAALLLKSLGRLWLAGVGPDWEGFVKDERRRRVPLPTYPFERRRYWIERTDSRLPADAATEEERPLPAASHGRPHLDTPYVAPRDETEEKAAGVWRELLGLAEIGIHDNFFELGGHSLLATRVASQLSDVLGTAVPLSTLFEAPTVAGLVARLATGSAGREEERPGAVAVLPPLTPDPAQRHEPFPLNDLQQAYWVGRSADFDMGNVGTHLYFELESGELDLDRLEEIWRRLIDRHEMLRAVVLSDGRQRILERVPEYRFTRVDLSGLAKGEETTRLAAIRHRLSHQRFSTERWPLFDIAASRLGNGRTRLHISIDGLLLDGWSFGILFRELSALHRGEADPPPLELSFRDYVLAEQRLRETEPYQRALDEWRRRLPDLPPAPQLPLAVHPSSVREPRFRRLDGRIAPETWERLKRRAGRAGLSPTGLLISAFAQVLARWSKSPRFTLNVPRFNRLALHPQVYDILGQFASFTPLAVDGFAVESFEERARRLQSRLWQDLDQGLVSGVELLREWGRILGSTSEATLPVVFTSAPEAADGSSASLLPALETLGEVTYSISQAPQVWLDHQMGERGGALEFNWDAVEQLFPAALLDEMFAAYSRLLHRLAEEESAWREARPELLSPGRLAWHAALAGAEEPVPALSLEELFAERASRDPERPAVASSAGTLSYGELDRLANRIAQRLRELGARPNTLIAVVMEKGWEQVAAAHGVLRSGAAYLPIDPAVPGERLRHLLAQGEVSLVLTQPQLDRALEWPEEVRRLPLGGLEAPAGTLGPDFDGASVLPLPRVQGPDDLAYVIFTSGSTGSPKGAMIAHRGAVNAVLATNQRFLVGPGDRALAVTALHHDMSVYDLFGVLAAGGLLVMPDASARLDAAHWASLMRQHEVTLWNSVPAMMEMLLEHAGERPGVLPASLRIAFLGGDWIAVDLPKRLRALVPNAQVVSVGGPTETTLWNIWYPVEEVDPAWPSIPYGRPIANTRYYVLSETFEDRPVWVPGEMCCAGVGLALGYWRDEEKTHTAFITHPRTGERLYRTGDLGRYLPDGNLQFLGREDFQVKIHGQRIELGEIEAVLAKHPAVRAAVVTAQGEATSRRLVAYVVPERRSAEPGERVEERVTRWRTVFDETYRHSPAEAASDFDFDITGWNSSYTGEPIPAAEMAEWVDAIVARILARRPRRVLEIGCGTGLLLLRIAPRCDFYCATDFSGVVLEALARRVESAGLGNRVELLQRDAQDLSGIADGAFDAVVINSVVQYLPGVDYLVRLLETAATKIAPGGFLWVGDVRSLPLLEAFHTSVELDRAPDALPLAELRGRVRESLENDDELVLDPEFFRALAGHLPGVGRVALCPKEGRSRNEMTLFRYDAVLEMGSRTAPAVAARRLDWTQGRLDLPSLRLLLEGEQPEALVVTGIPDARLAPEMEAMRRLAGDDGPATVGELRQELRSVGQGAQPADLADLGRSLSYAVALSSRRGEAGRFDLWLRRGPALAEELIEEEALAPGPWSGYASSPLRAGFARDLVPELRRFLRAQLPDHMVPAVYVPLEALPLTANGKVDRRALPDPELRGLGQGSHESASPRTGTERVLADVWRELLGVAELGREDNFFELGGNSLLATQIVTRVREAFAIELPLRRLFEQPTIAGLAASLDEIAREQNRRVSPPVRPVPRHGELPLSFAQQRLWLVEQLAPDLALYGDLSAVRLGGPLEAATLARVLVEVARRHETLRTTFPAPEGIPIQIIAPEPRVDLPVIDLSGLPASEREAEALRRAASEARGPFDLARGPLLRAFLLRLNEREHVLLLNLHHIVSDAWSRGVLLREVALLYQAFAAGAPSPLPMLPVQYADYAVWQREWLTGDVLAEQLAYWRRQLAGAPPVLALPADRPRPRIQSFRGAERPFEIPQELAHGLRELARSTEATLFMVLLAAFKVLLWRWTGQQDLVVGTDAANRNRREIEPLIGFFVNILPLRTWLGGQPTFRELAARVREVTLEAYAHEDLPFDRLVEELRPERSLESMPLVQVLFLLDNTPSPRAEIGELSLSPVRIPVEVSRFDLAVFLSEENGRIVGNCVYSTDLFEASTVGRMLDRYLSLLVDVVARPDVRIETLQVRTDEERRKQAVKERARMASKFDQFMKIQPKTVNLSQEELIRTSSLPGSGAFPLLIEPALEGVDLADWCGRNRDLVERQLSTHGALLFRGFGIRRVVDFERVASSLCEDLYADYGDLPPEEGGEKVYRSTPYPPDKVILFHNESSHLDRWPSRQWFCCLKAALKGGETPIVDCRKVYRALSRETRERFAAKGLMYVRNFTDGLDVNWRDFFHTTDKAQVEEACRRAGMRFEWKSGDGLRTRKVCPAVIQHPRTGEMVFFNQVQLHHISCLDPATRESLLSMFGRDDLPRNVYYGDGSPIDDATMKEVGEALWSNAVAFPWQEGDILMVDNMLVAHARNPYEGDRRIAVAMGAMVGANDLAPVPVDIGREV